MNIQDYPHKLNMDEIISMHIIKENPLPQPRPRITRGRGVFYSKKNVAYKNSLAVQFKAHLSDKDRANFDAIFGIRVFFYRSTRQRCDIDNLIKAVQDAGTGILWKDDCQIHEVFGKKFYDKDFPRLELLIYKSEIVGELGSIIKNICPSCKNQFESYKSHGAKTGSGRTFCSVQCRHRFHNIEINCKGCSKRFLVARSKLKAIKGFCTRKCGIDYWQQHRPDSSRNWKCEVCGNGVSRKEYKRCRGCAWINRELGNSNYWNNRNAI